LVFRQQSAELGDEIRDHASAGDVHFNRWTMTASDQRYDVVESPDARRAELCSGQLTARSNAHCTLGFQPEFARNLRMMERVSSEVEQQTLRELRVRPD
jgi:hypothetical protein